ncbi:MAG: hypothetical protein Q9M14_04785 [Mariprofundaceae bacterium]|nr:hypothetical protein [Mariprofundaceae bacterium]
MWRSYRRYKQAQSRLNFSIYLPLDDNDEVILEEYREVIEGCGETILLVDDNESARKAMTRLLVSLNYRNYSAPHPKMAVTAQVAPDLFEFKEKIRSVLLHLSIFDAEIGQIRDGLSSYPLTNHLYPEYPPPVSR